jgi:hypothetical protein
MRLSASYAVIFWARRDTPQHGVVEAAEERHALAHLLQREDAGVEAVVQVGGQVGDLVGQIDQLRFQRRKLVEEVLGQLRVLGGGVVARVLDDALAHAQRQIQPAKAGVALLKPGHDAQRVQVVVEAQAQAAQALVEGLFAGVAKGRMADVVRQRQRLGQLRIQPQRAASVRDLGHFQGVGQAAAEVVRRGVAGQAREDLRLAGQAAKGARVQNAGAVAGKGRAVGVRRLGCARRLSSPSARTAIPGGQREGRFGVSESVIGSPFRYALRILHFLRLGYAIDASHVPEISIGNPGGKTTCSQ